MSCALVLMAFCIDLGCILHVFLMHVACQFLMQFALILPAHTISCFLVVSQHPENNTVSSVALLTPDTVTRSPDTLINPKSLSLSYTAVTCAIAPSVLLCATLLFAVALATSLRVDRSSAPPKPSRWASSAFGTFLCGQSRLRCPLTPQ